MHVNNHLFKVPFLNKCIEGLKMESTKKERMSRKQTSIVGLQVEQMKPWNFAEGAKSLVPLKPTESEPVI